jgi:hypothetical protein
LGLPERQVDVLFKLLQRDRVDNGQITAMVAVDAHRTTFYRMDATKIASSSFPNPAPVLVMETRDLGRCD